jgi:hypothetical protein
MMTFRDESVIRHHHRDDIDTFRHVASSTRTDDTPPPAATPTPMDVPTTSPIEGLYPAVGSTYVAPMTTSANSVLAAIDARRPDQTDTRKHLLLFFCQGHFFAGTGAPLFAEPIYATPTGVHIDMDPTEPATDLNNRQLGFIGSTLHRYADMTDADLLSLVQISSAWQLARRHEDDPRIEWVWLGDWFRRSAERHGAPTAEEAADFAARHKARAGG